LIKRIASRLWRVHLLVEIMENCYDGKWTWKIEASVLHQGLIWRTVTRAHVNLENSQTIGELEDYFKGASKKTRRCGLRTISKEFWRRLAEMGTWDWNFKRNCSQKVIIECSYTKFHQLEGDIIDNQNVIFYYIYFPTLYFSLVITFQFLSSIKFQCVSLSRYLIVDSIFACISIIDFVPSIKFRRYIYVRSRTLSSMKFKHNPCTCVAVKMVIFSSLVVDWILAQFVCTI